MPKVIESPIEQFPGKVTLYDPLNMLQVLVWEKGFRSAQELGDKATLSEVNAAYMPAVLACVEKWEISGVPEQPTPETFPFSPRLPSARLLDWLIGEISRVYFGEAEVKND